MLQVLNIEVIFKRYFIEAIVPKRIIELGTLAGDFSMLIYNLREQIDPDFDFITFDNIIQINNIPPKMSFCQLDIFNHIDFIGGMIEENTLVLCDNGDKIREVHALAPYLKNNCVIMAHDYFPTKENFLERNCWPVCEITDSDVQDLYMELNPYKQEIMTEGLWLSLIKRKHANSRRVSRS
jgi:hypothetical protein